MGDYFTFTFTEETSASTTFTTFYGCRMMPSASVHYEALFVDGCIDGDDNENITFCLPYWEIWDVDGTTNVTSTIIENSHASGGCIFNAWTDIPYSNFDAGGNEGWVFDAPEPTIRKRYIEEEWKCAPKVIIGDATGKKGH